MRNESWIHTTKPISEEQSGTQYFQTRPVSEKSSFATLPTNSELTGQRVNQTAIKP